MGKILRLSGVNLTDAFAPQIIERDLIESAGSLFLFDVAHDFGTFTGVPGSGQAIPNVLSNKAALLLGGDASSQNFTVAAKNPDSAIWKTERTLRGGVHGIITQAGSQAVTLGMNITPANSIRDHILENMTTHRFYFSLWSVVTRKGIDTTSDQSPFHFAQNTSNFLFHMENGLPSPNSVLTREGSKQEPTLGDSLTSTAAPYSRFASIGVIAPTNAGPASTSSFGLRLGTADAWAAINYNKAPSRIIYRAYAEDMTVSGRTYAEVQAIDYAMYQAAFAVGGKFYGDTFTDPATIP